MNRPGPAASCTTRASIAACTGWRVEAAMMPQPIVRRSVSRAMSAPTPVEERASIPCLRHQGYASASQIVSRPASSIARADATISSSGSMVSCMTPIRKGGEMALALGRGDGALGLLRRRGLLHLLFEGRQDVLNLLVDDRLEDALPHRPDRAGDAPVGLPVHLRPACLVAEVERGRHAQDRPDAVTLDRQARELRLTLLGLLHVH